MGAATLAEQTAAIARIHADLVRTTINQSRPRSNVLEHSQPFCVSSWGACME
jgi:hypothetical protein